MAKRVLLYIVVAATVALGGWYMTWLGWLCGPSGCGRGSWLYDYQTLITGILAIAAAAIAVIGAVIIDRRQHSRRRAGEQESQINACVNTATALAPYVMGIQEVAELALRESREHTNPTHEPLRMAIPLAEERCTEGRRAVSGVPIALHQRLLSLMAEFEILLFKARVALAYRDSTGARHEIQITGLEDVVKRAEKLQVSLRDWHRDPG